MLLAFDIGGTKCAVVLGKNVAGELQVVAKRSVPTNKPVYEMIEALYGMADELLSDHNVSVKDIDGVGISCGGPLSSKRGIILSPPNLIGWDNVPIVDMTLKRFG